MSHQRVWERRKSVFLEFSAVFSGKYTANFVAQRDVWELFVSSAFPRFAKVGRWRSAYLYSQRRGKYTALIIRIYYKTRDTVLTTRLCIKCESAKHVSSTRGLLAYTCDNYSFWWPRSQCRFEELHISEIHNESGKARKFLEIRKPGKVESICQVKD